MPIQKKIFHSAARAMGVLFIALNLGGIFGVWEFKHGATRVALKGFGIIEAAVGIVDVGVARVDDLITRTRTEVRQASDTIIAVATRADVNRPVLVALNERLETTVAPRIAQIQQMLAPVRDAVGTIGNAVSLVNSLPMMADRAPRLAALDEAFLRLEGISVDATQLRSTLRALAMGQPTEFTAEVVATLRELTQRIEIRMSEVQSGVQGVQADSDALQGRLDTRKPRVLFVFNLLASLMTLMLVWVLYSQIVVIRHHRR